MQILPDCIVTPAPSPLNLADGEEEPLSPLASTLASSGLAAAGHFSLDLLESGIASSPSASGFHGALFWCPFRLRAGLQRAPVLRSLGLHPGAQGVLIPLAPSMGGNTAFSAVFCSFCSLRQISHRSHLGDTGQTPASGPEGEGQTSLPHPPGS